MPVCRPSCSGMPLLDCIVSAQPQHPTRRTARETAFDSAMMTARRMSHRLCGSCSLFVPHGPHHQNGSLRRPEWLVSGKKRSHSIKLHESKKVAATPRTAENHESTLDLRILGRHAGNLRSQSEVAVSSVTNWPRSAHDSTRNPTQKRPDRGERS